MSAKKTTADAKTTTRVVDVSADQKGQLKSLGGSRSDRWNRVLADQAMDALWVKNSSPEEKEKKLVATCSALVGIAPKDELEGMMAAQLIACHNAAMECYRRAMHGEQTFAGRSENLSQANKLSRSFSTLLEALNRHRGKGQQTVRVEHVTVNAGGQAIVGNIEAGGGAKTKSEGQSHAKIAHALDSALWSEDAERDAMPIAGNAERPMQDARRNEPRRAQGQ
jgi:hypothetical protein